jgi:hypothetical protein
MTALEDIANDLLASPHIEAIGAILGCQTDDHAQIRLSLLIKLDDLEDFDSISELLKEWLGKIGICQALSYCGITFSPRDTIDDLVRMWLNFRGLSPSFPRARPRELIHILRETVTQVSVNTASFKALEVAGSELECLLRFLIFYYVHGFSRDITSPKFFMLP